MFALLLALFSLTAGADEAVECATEPYFSTTEQETQCLERMRLLMETQELRGQLVRSAGSTRELELRVRLDRAEQKLARTPCKLTKRESERNCVAVNRSRDQKTRMPASIMEGGEHEAESAR